MKDHLSIMAIVPCYNEEGRIAKTLNKLIPEVDSVCVINDGSTDNTIKEIENIDNIDIISYSINRGKGYAIKQGINHFLKSNFDVVLFIDADGQHSPENIKCFKKKFKDNVDVVVASRFGTKEWQENMPILRKISNLLSRFGIWILYNGFVVEDPQNGFRAYRREVMEVIEFDTCGYEAETEIIIDAYLKGFRFDKVYIKSIYNNEENHSKFSLFRDTWKIPGVMVRGFFRHKPFIFRSYGKKILYRNSRKKLIT